MRRRRQRNGVGLPGWAEWYDSWLRIVMPISVRGDAGRQPTRTTPRVSWVNRSGGVLSGALSGYSIL